MEQSFPNPQELSKTLSMTKLEQPTIYFGRILLGEISPLLSSMKKSSARWSSNQQDDESDPLVKQLRDLQINVLHLRYDSVMEPSRFLEPFLNIISSEDVIGPITKNSLSAVNRMLSFGLINPNSENAANAVESIASTVTRTRFVGTDAGADEVVLWEILTVLRTLMLGPVGHLLTNESVCEILIASFRICFETRLSELLRNCTEDAMRHMIQLLFSRLPQFKDDPRNQTKKLKMTTGAGSEIKGKKSKTKFLSSSPPSDVNINAVQEETSEKPTSTIPESLSESTPLEDSGSSPQLPVAEQLDCNDSPSVMVSDSSKPVVPDSLDVSHTHLAPELTGSEDSLQLASPDSEIPDQSTHPLVVSLPQSSDSEVSKTISEETSEGSIASKTNNEFTNLQGVKFTQPSQSIAENGLLPYGLPCVKEVLRYLISLISLKISDKNTSHMIHTSLNLLTVALEIGAEHISQSPALLLLVRDQLCRNLFMNLKPDTRPAIFMASLRVCTLLFESLRMHLKFQLEMFLNKLVEIISSESPHISYFYKEHSLETILQLWRMPGLIAEIFVNFDCNIYSGNIFEDLTKILSKNAFPVQALYSTNLLSLEALLTVIEVIESHTPNTGQLNRSSKKTCGVPSALVAPSSGYLLGIGLLGGFSPVTPQLKAAARLTNDATIDRQDLLNMKDTKNIIATATAMFNEKPEKGLAFLQTNGIIETTNVAVAYFVRENPHLDKKVMGDYLSKKKNVDILSAFVKSFEFDGRRIDECLRTFLESFRLPGEAPLISIVIEHFSSHWHSSNGYPFRKDDAAFTLAYAVIMLNVDQHNQNAKKQNVPMTVEQFCKNLRGVNDGIDFEKQMLEQIYKAIHDEEIVMPAEQSGEVKENYLWKMLLKRGATKEGTYLLINDSFEFDRDLFALCWGPTVASLSYVFDKSSDDSFIQNALSGFRKCASISARFGMSDVFDNLVITLCKFTTLTVACRETPESVAVSFGKNRKAQLAARTLFRLITSHADILRDGWRNILELLLQLFRCHLLPSVLVESEDFVEPSGRIRLVRETFETIPRVESGLFSSLYSYIALGDSSANKGVSPEDEELIKLASHCVMLCHPEKLITESAFLRYDSLNELLKAMIRAGNANNMTEMYTASPTKSSAQTAAPSPDGLDEYSQAFLLELVISVLVANKDRAGGVWPSVRDHIYSLLMGAVAVDRHFLLERCVVAILRIAKVLLRRPELSNPILQSLRMLLVLRPEVLDRVALQIVFGIHEVLSVNADHVQDSNDWAILLALLECAGAGAKPPPIVSSDGQPDRGSETENNSAAAKDSGHSSEGEAESPPASATETEKPKTTTNEAVPNGGGWILVGREGEIEPVAIRSLTINEWDIVHQRRFSEHKPEALAKAVDTISLLVRERHITAVNLPCVVQTCRTFVEATLHAGCNESKQGNLDVIGPSSKRKGASRKPDTDHRSKSPNRSSPQDSDCEDLPQSYQQISEKLLDLMDTLHTSASYILELKSQEEQPLHCFQLNQSLSLWQQALCPLLQGIARYCCDVRPLVRSLSMTYLQRALLNHDLQTLNASEWESCFNKVLFPLLAKLLQPMNFNGVMVSLEETRVRAATLVQKVFLRHLTPLLSLPTFTALWLTVLDFMDKYLNTHRSDHLGDAIPEILKNMLLVMETTQVFHTTEGFTQLWSITWDRIDAFLPDLRHDLFKSHPPSEIHRSDQKSPQNDANINQQVTPEADSNAPPIAEAQVDISVVTPKPDEAIGLCLGQEDNPERVANNVILQPPLNHIFPISSSPPSLGRFQPPSSPLHGDHPQQNLLSDFRNTSCINLPYFLPITDEPLKDHSNFVPLPRLGQALATVVGEDNHGSEIPTATHHSPSAREQQVNNDMYKPASLLFANKSTTVEFAFNATAEPRDDHASPLDVNLTETSQSTKLEGTDSAP